jgi:hypothetical protein
MAPFLCGDQFAALPRATSPGCSASSGPCPGKRFPKGTRRTAAPTAASNAASSRRLRSPPCWRSRTPLRPSRSPAAPVGRQPEMAHRDQLRDHQSARGPGLPRPARHGSGATGRSRTSSTGSATSPSVRTPAPHAPAPGRTSWPPSATWSSASCAWPATTASPALSATPPANRHVRSACSQARRGASYRLCR